MKYLIIALCLISCNPKKEIVNAQRRLKDSINLLSSEMDALNIKRRNLDMALQDSLINGNTDVKYNEQELTDRYNKISDFFKNEQQKIDDTITMLIKEQSPLQAKYDSLEFELKKY